MPANKNAFLRYSIIDSLLSKGRTLKKGQILNKIKDEGLEVSQYTFDKDLQVLRDDLKAPIKYDPRQRGYYYADKKFSLFSKLSKEDSSALLFANEVLNTIGPIDMVLEAQEVLSHLYDKLHMDEHNKGKQIICHSNTSPVKGLEWINAIYKAIESEKALTINYHKIQTGENKTHVISPYILRPYNHLWYVVAWSATQELTLIFALDRIREIKPAHVTWFKDPNFNLEQYFKHGFGISHSYDSQPKKVIFSINRNAFYYLDIRPLHPTQKVIEETNDGFVVELDVLISEELLMALMGLGNTIKVLEPVELVNQMKDRLTKSLMNYNS